MNHKYILPTMVQNYIVFNEKTLYTSPYMIVTEAEYTKHYYIESERVTTKLGGGFQPAPLNPMTDHVQYPVGKEYPILADALWERLKYTEECTGLNPNYVTGEHNNLLYAFDQWVGMDQYESNAFYYHSDHLGSSSLITDANGQLDQHYQYLPYGEPFVSQKINTGVRFTFSGKEMDSETGLSYFGARYYTSDLGVWLSVDPLAHEFPWSSPYVAFNNNPLYFIDPDGRAAVAADDYYRDENGDVQYNATIKSQADMEAKGIKGTYLGEEGEWLANDKDLNSMTYYSTVKIETEHEWSFLFGLYSKNFMLTNYAPINSNMTYAEFEEQYNRHLAANIYVGEFGDDAFKIALTANFTSFMNAMTLPKNGSFTLNSDWKNWSRYMAQRGWSNTRIRSTLQNGKWQVHKGSNHLNPGNPMFRVTNQGKSLIIDAKTREIIMLGGKGFKY